MTNIPSMHNLAGALVPLTNVPRMATGSVEQAIKGNLGDLALLFVMGVVPRLLEQVNVSSKFRRFSQHLGPAAEFGGVLFVVNLLDAGIVKFLQKISMDGKVKDALFGLVWWLPSRLWLGREFLLRTQWILNGNINENVMLRRGLAVAFYFGCFFLVRDGIEVKVSELMQYVLPVFVATMSGLSSPF